MHWLLFLPQLPASPSTLRVMVWRRMRAAGALGLQNGVWVLPQTPEEKQFAEELLAYIQEHGANGFVFEVGALNQSIEDDILEQFRADRDEEYIEFCERCDALLAELERETSQEKFTFAELEETEEDLQKLKNWLGKIKARDFYSGKKRSEALDKLELCQTAHQIFASNVYVFQGIDLSSNQGE
ncbi:MAG: Chromate resistance protein ChrB [Anaerolineales bacterium]